MALDLDMVANEMFEMVSKDQGEKKYKPGDLFDAMLKKYKSQGLSKRDCKSAIRTLIDDEKLVYTYFGGPQIDNGHLRLSARVPEMVL